MGKIIERLLDINLPDNRSAFLWGPRKTGKTYWVGERFKDSVIIDLLKTDVFADYVSRPSLLREQYRDHKDLVIIDEIQMVPDLLNEIHWLIETSKTSFLMTGSNARKLRRNHANFLGGRAWRYSMAPLSYMETEKFYLFDIGVSNYLARRKPRAGTPEFGKSFEHFILMELKAYQAYRDPEPRIYSLDLTRSKVCKFCISKALPAPAIKKKLLE